MFDAYLRLWNLMPDGDVIVTPRARLLPVRRDGEPAMLKVATDADEKYGGILLDWWDGDGAARVLAAQGEGEAILIERATSGRWLADLVREGGDDAATHVICDVTARLHAPRAKPLPELVPLPVWFRDLEPAVASHGGVFSRSAEAARRLLAEPREEGVLHGDIHHENILDFGPRGWLVIDPKHLRGERAFDYAILFCDPDLGDPSFEVARSPERFASRLAIVTDRAGIERRRMLEWIIAWTGLSAAWNIGDNLSPEIELRVADMAIAALDKG